MAVAAYASLVSLTQVLDHPRLFPNTKLIQSLHEKVHFLQEFFEIYSGTNSHDIEEDLTRQIAEISNETEDIIDFHVVDQLREEYEDRIYTGQIIEAHLVDEVKNEMEISSSFCQDIDKVIEKFDFMKKELLTMVKVGKDVTEQQPTIASRSTLPSSGTNTVVGFDKHLVRIMDQLTSYQPDLHIIPIVGMGGIGKTTLAKTTFDNQYIMNHFDVRVWFTISQEYSVHQILLGILRDIGVVDDDLKSDKLVILQEKLHKHLFNRRYLIVMDDVWSIEAFDHLKLCFPDYGNGSRVILTTRLTNVAVSLGSYNPYSMDFLDDDKSWDLLCQKAFSQGNFYPELVEIGKKIATSCRGLPLAIVVIGGLLAKSEMTLEKWEFIAENVISNANSENDEQCLKILALSYKHLPIHLKPCFLYMSVFSEDSEIQVSKLIKLWIAEGFIKPLGVKNMEQTGEDYLKDLIDRNLIFVRALGRTNKVKKCGIHDLLRDLCIREYQKENLCCNPKVQEINPFLGGNVCFVCAKRVAHARMNVSKLQIESQSTLLVSCFVCNACRIMYPQIMRFRFTRVALHNVTSNEEYFLQHTKLRYLSLHHIREFVYPSSFPLLWNLQTLTIDSPDVHSVVLPSIIWDMPQLRHVVINHCFLPDPILNEITILENLNTLSTIGNFNCTENTLERIPNLKKLKLSCNYGSKPVDWSCYSLCNLSRLHKLESLSLDYSKVIMEKIAFPSSLRKLSLSWCAIPWEHMTLIGSLPNLEVLKLRSGAFTGPEWNQVEGEFLMLKSLLLSRIDLVHWGAKDIHFPRLENIELQRMYDLKEIPSGFGDIPTLRLIHLVRCYDLVHSAKEILEEQRTLGNEGLHVLVTNKRGTGQL